MLKNALECVSSTMTMFFLDATLQVTQDAIFCSEAGGIKRGHMEYPQETPKEKSQQISNFCNQMMLVVQDHQSGEINVIVYWQK